MTCLHAATTCPDCAPLTPAELRDLTQTANLAQPRPCCAGDGEHHFRNCDGLDLPAVMDVEASIIRRLVREVRASRVLLAGGRP